MVAAAEIRPYGQARQFRTLKVWEASASIERQRNKRGSIHNVSHVSLIIENVTEEYREKLPFVTGKIMRMSDWSDEFGSRIILKPGFDQMMRKAMGGDYILLPCSTNYLLAVSAQEDKDKLREWMEGLVSERKDWL